MLRPVSSDFYETELSEDSVLPLRLLSRGRHAYPDTALGNGVQLEQTEIAKDSVLARRLLKRGRHAYPDATLGTENGVQLKHRRQGRHTFSRCELLNTRNGTPNRRRPVIVSPD